MIRAATLEDVDGIIQLGVELIRHGAYSHTMISYKACVDRLIRAISRPDEWLGVAVHEGKVVGFMLLVYQNYWWSSQDFYAVDDGIFCTRAGLGRKLVNAGLQWAAKKGASEVMIALTSAYRTDRSVRTLRRSGFLERGVVVVFEKGQEVCRWAA